MFPGRKALRSLLVTTLMTATPGGTPPPSDLPGPGVPHDLARNRAPSLREVRYELAFTVPAVRSKPVTGTLVLRFELAVPIPRLILDFAGPPDSVRDVRLDGGEVPATVRSEHVVIDGPLAPGSHEVRLAFAASDDPLNRDEEFLYSLFVPARARQAFPCFDQPDVKARLGLTLDVPASWRVVANGAEQWRREHGDRVVVGFVETPPLPTYLMAFAAGRFEVEEAQRNGRTFRMFHRETDEARLARNLDAIFDLHAAALAWMEAYTGIPYPWGKFDFFLAPAFQFGGMEHAGAIFYNAPVLLLEPSATQNQLLRRASLIAHETAHMWFGDLVTMRWFDDVWLKEVFANFMAAKIVNPSFPDIDHDLRFLDAHYRAAYDVDRTAGTHAIRQPLENLADAGSLYGAIIYEKAPIVMRQLERLMGEEVLRDGLRAYLEAHAFQNATWDDLVSRLDALTSVDLAAWSEVWVNQAGRPRLRVVAAQADDPESPLLLLQEDPRGHDRLWPQALIVEVGRDGEVGELPVNVTSVRSVVDVPEGLRPPAYVLPTGDGLGYGDFVLTQPTRSWLLSQLPDLPDALSRGAAWLTLWEEMLEARVTPQALSALCLQALERENDQQNVERLLTDLETLYWRLLPPPEREALTGRIELLLRRGLERATTATAKGAWFRSLTRLARTPDQLSWLRDVWNGDVDVTGLTVAEPEQTLLAQELAVRAVTGWRDILDRQEARIDNADRRERFAFARPALDDDPEVREAFFASLAEPARRRREPWVLDALGYLHHPLRADQSERFIAPSLAMLEEIQRTGDIFFPKRWLDATLSGHRSGSAAATVAAFLNSRADLSPRLRRLVLQSSDTLRRIAEWKGR